jgi:peptidoglycan hydrolase-like protein with peptidoglycan-binding domain
MYVIWNGKIWSTYRLSEGWRKYTGSESHADHIHISMAWNGALERTSWWTGKAAATDYGPCPAIEGELAPKYSGPRATPCPAPTPIMSLTGKPVLKLESTGPYVKQLQRLLAVTPVSGYFGPVTDAALRKYQGSHNIKVTGITYGNTWDALRAAPVTAGSGSPASTPSTSSGTQARAFPNLLARMKYKVKKGDTLSGIAKHWRSSVSAIKTVNKLRSNTIRRGQVLVIPVRSSLTRYSWTTIRKGNHNKTVLALQKALRMPKKYRTGLYGSITRRYVKKFERAHHLRVDGIAGPEVWRALGA